MPELPDIDVYVEKLEQRIAGATLTRIRVNNPFLVRSVLPALSVAHGKSVTTVRRLGKRIVIGLDGDFWLVLHLMIAGRLQWHEAAVPLRGKLKLAAFEFNTGNLVVTEAGTQKRASLHLLDSIEALAAHDPGGIEPLECSLDEFVAGLLSENRSLKRALTNPRTFSGIGNAYSDEILHAARLSPVKLTRRLSAPEQARLYDATRATLANWRERLRAQCGDDFPAKVTAFRPDMAVHGRFGEACPECGSKVARIRYKNKETNYCARCQNNGKLLADRSLSRLLKDDWPDTL